MTCILEDGYQYRYKAKDGYASQLHIDANLRFDWPVSQIQIKVDGKVIHEKTDITDIWNEIINVELMNKEVTSFINVFRTEPNPIRIFCGKIIFKDQEIPVNFSEQLRVQTVIYIFAKKHGFSVTDLKLIKSGADLGPTQQPFRFCANPGKFTMILMTAETIVTVDI
jgi:hypothetical protein